MLLLSHFSRVRLCATPQTAAHQAPPSLGFSRQEQWSGLPFPSPMHESEKWKWSRSVVSDPQRPRGLQPSRLLRPWDYPDKCAGVGCHCLLRASYYRIIIHLCYRSLVSLQAFLLMITFQRKWFLLCGIHFGIAMRLVVTRFFIKCSCVHGPMLVWVYKIDMVSKAAEWIVETI